jgi:diadenylate cyclase
MSHVLGVIASPAGMISSDTRTVAETLLVTALFYSVFRLMSSTTGFSILRGIAILYLGLGVLSNVFGLTTVGWALRNSLPLLSVALVVLFAPELRRALENITRGDDSGASGGAA